MGLLDVLMLMGPMWAIAALKSVITDNSVSSLGSE